MLAQTLDLIDLEDDLRLALAHGELMLVFQPLTDLATAEIVGAEVLLRWNNRQRGMIMPARFVPVGNDKPIWPQRDALIRPHPRPV